MLLLTQACLPCRFWANVYQARLLNGASSASWELVLSGCSLHLLLDAVCPAQCQALRQLQPMHSPCSHLVPTSGHAALQLLDVVLGQDLPDVNASTVFYKIFAPLVATIGLVAFALVLALVEQLVLQVLEDNVKRGSRVFETGHVSHEAVQNLRVVWPLELLLREQLQLPVLGTNPTISALVNVFEAGHMSPHAFV